MKKRIKMRTRVIQEGSILNEEYNIDKNLNPEVFAKDLIEKFNNTLRINESPRELVSVEVIGLNTLSEHSWEKQNLVTIVKGNMSYDIMRCKNCGVTGKRYGLGRMVIDSKFKAKCYSKCETSLEQMEKNKKRRNVND